MYLLLADADYLNLNEQDMDKVMREFFQLKPCGGSMEWSWESAHWKSGHY